jgi:hypothetical protein
MSGLCEFESGHVRFALKATEMLHGSEMTLRARNRHPALRKKLWRLAESFQFGIGTLVFDEGLWTFSNRQVEQAHRFVLVAALQRQFATEEIDLADMSLLDAGIGIVRGRQYRLHGQLAKIEADDRRRPIVHVDLSGRFEQDARYIAAPIADV